MTSSIVTGRSETVRSSGRPDNRLELEECSCARVSTESRVTPGRIMPSRGGVTSSKPCGRARMNTCPCLNGRRLTSIIFSEDDEKVHGTNFGEIVFWTMKPQILFISLKGSFFLRKDPWRVVDTQLVGAGAWTRRTNV